MSVRRVRVEDCLQGIRDDAVGIALGALPFADEGEAAQEIIRLADRTAKLLGMRLHVVGYPPEEG